MSLSRLTGTIRATKGSQCFVCKRVIIIGTQVAMVRLWNDDHTVTYGDGWAHAQHLTSTPPRPPRRRSTRSNVTSIRYGRPRRINDILDEMKDA